MCLFPLNWNQTYTLNDSIPSGSYKMEELNALKNGLKSTELSMASCLSFFSFCYLFLPAFMFIQKLWELYTTGLSWGWKIQKTRLSENRKCQETNEEPFFYSQW